MRYSVALGPDAKKDFDAINRIDVDLAEFVIDSLEELAERPTLLSSRCDYPAPKGQRFIFRGPGLFAAHHFVVIFEYNQHEDELIVSQIGHVAL